MSFLTWNGTPLLVPDQQGELDQWLRQFQTIHELLAFCEVEQPRLASANVPQSYAGCGITPPNWTELPPLAINQLVWPTGATRWGYFVGLVPLNAAVGPVGGSGTLSLNDGSNTLNVEMMQLLTWRKVTAFPSLALIVLVDRRYRFQFIDCGNFYENSHRYSPVDQSPGYSGTPNNDYGQYEATWYDLIGECFRLVGGPFSFFAPDNEYLSPDPQELVSRKWFNVAMMIDAIAESIGARTFLNWDGTFQLVRPQEQYLSNFDDTKNLIAGGLQPGQATIVNRVTVSFPRATYGRAYQDKDQIAYSVDFNKGSTGTINVMSSCYANWTTEPDNYINLSNNEDKLKSLASAIASAIGDWIDIPYDATWMGIKNWKLSGYDNFVCIRYGVVIPNDVYISAVVDDSQPKEDTKFQTNYYAFTTRAQSQPANFGTRINLSQDPSIRFLRGWQWGRLTENQTPSVKDSDGQTIAQPTTIAICQYGTLGQEIATPIEIQAYPFDADGELLKLGDKVSLEFSEVSRRWIFCRYIASSTAKFIRFQIQTQPLGTLVEKVKATVLEYWDGNNPDPDNEGVDVYNLLTNQPNTYLWFAPRNAVGIATWDGTNRRYRILVMQTYPQFVIGKLTSDLGDGFANGSVTYSWGPTTGVPLPSTITVNDKTNPTIFTGTSGDQYHASLDALTGEYVLTWVQCQ